MIYFDEVIMQITTIEAIIAGGLAILSSVIGALLSNRSQERKIYSQVNRKIGEIGNVTLSGQHEVIIEKINDSSKAQSDGQKMINGNINRVSAEIRDINTLLKINEEREKGRYSALSDSQKKLDFQIEGVKATIAELNRLQIENQLLNKRVIELEYQLERYHNISFNKDIER